MKQFVIGLVVLFCLQECKINKEKRIHKGDFDLVGLFINDTIPDGTIKYFDKLNKLVSIRNYTLGILNGSSLNYYSNGKIYDSCNYINGKQFGFDCIFDSLGNIRYKANYYFGKQIGPVYTYNTLNQVIEYSFNNFENDILYYYSYDTNTNKEYYPSDHYLLKATSKPLSEDDLDGINVFLYLIQPPHLKLSYKICHFNKNNKVVDSFIIHSNNFYFEKFIKFLWIV